MFNLPKVEIIKLVDVKDVDWCEEAVLFRVKRGKGTLTHRISEEDEEYMYNSQLLLNDRPIIQAKYPICPTCAGMLATGYGIENIHCRELTRVRECINSEYKGIMNAAEHIKPLLGLLRDGYYLLADAKLYPSDGQGEFFYSVPNELSYNEASCSEYYDSNLHCSTDGFPAYIYPTQSSALIQEQRVEKYIEMMKNCTNPPRGLAYYEEGFVCALLDGHHKACVSSALGKLLNCLTIIAADKFVFEDGAKYAEEHTRIKSVGFAGIMIDAEPGTKMNDYRPIKGTREKEIHMPVYNLTGRKFPEKYYNSYPTIQTLAGISNAEVDAKGDVVEYAKQLILSRDEEEIIKLDYLLQFLSGYRKEEAYTIAKLIFDNFDEYYLREARKSAVKEMLKHHNEETEQYMIDYLVDHTSKDECWDLVNSYWE